MKYRNDIPNNLKTVVIKLGSTSVTKENGGVDSKKLNNILEDVSTLHAANVKVVIVCSGAIHTAREFLNLDNSNISNLQAMSAVGQPIIFQHIQKYFIKKEIRAAQILLTHEDFKNRNRFFNAKSTVETLLKNNIIPILNENDTVSFSEITVGDNDQLAAMTTMMVNADLLVMLSNMKGLYDGDPDDKKSNLIPYVEFKTNLSNLKTFKKSIQGRGGMLSKLESIGKVTPLGIPVILSTYDIKNPILAALTKKIGTVFKTEKKHLSRKAWILSTVKNNFKISVDHGAYLAISKNSSILPSGIICVDGQFKRGDCINILYKNKSFAVGVSEYTSGEIKKILGLKSSQIKNALGYCQSKVVVHRNHLVLKEK